MVSVFEVGGLLTGNDTDFIMVPPYFPHFGLRHSKEEDFFPALLLLLILVIFLLHV